MMIGTNQAKPSSPPAPRSASPAPPKDSARVPDILSAPRSTISNVNRLFKAAEGLEWIDNPLPGGVQDTVSVLGAGFAAFNIGAELKDRDWMGALEDTAGGAVSLLGGVRLMTEVEGVRDGFGLAGAALNTGMAVRDLKNGKLYDASMKIADAAGLTMTALGCPVVNSIGLTILGVSGLVDIAVTQTKKLTSANDNEPPSALLPPPTPVAPHPAPIASPPPQGYLADGYQPGQTNPAA